jgi:hypothetical protein
MRKYKTKTKVEQLKICGGCGWLKEGCCILYCGKLESKNDKFIRLSVCIDSEEKGLKNA